MIENDAAVSGEAMKQHSLYTLMRGVLLAYFFCSIMNLSFANTLPENTLITPLKSQASFSNKQHKKTPHKIAYMPPATEFNYYLELWKGISAAASATKNEVFLLAPQKDNPTEQIKMLSNVIQTDVSAIIFATHDEVATAPLIKQAIAKGIIVIIVNTDDINYPTPVHAIVGYKQRKSTYLLGQYALSLTQRKTINVGIIEGEKGYHSEQRVTGFTDAIKNSQLQVIARANGHWSTEGGYAATLEMFRNHPDINLVFAANDFEIIGVEAALKALNIQNVLLFGNDGVPSVIDAIANKRIAATMYANPQEMGKVAFSATLDSLTNDFKGGYIETAMTLITPDNADLHYSEKKWQPNDLKEIIITGETTAGLANKDGSGLYWDIMRAIYEPLGIKVTIKSLPLKRSQLMVESQKADMMLGNYRGYSNNLIFSQWHYDTKDIVAIFKKSTLPWHGQQSISGKRVAWVRGSNYDNYLSVDVITKEQNNHVSPLIMLERARVDYFLCDRAALVEALEDSAKHLQEAGFNQDDYQIKSLFKLKLYPAFTNTPRGQKLAEIFDSQLPQLLHSGKLKAIFDNWNTPIFPFDY